MRLSNEKKLFLTEAKTIAFNGLKQVISDTYAVELFFLPWFLNRLNNDPVNIAGNTLVLNFLNPLLIPAISPLFNIPFEFSKLFEIVNEKKTTKEEKKRAINEVQVLFRSSIYHTIFLATPITIFPMIFSKSVLVNVFYQDPEISAITQAILRKLCFFVIPTLLYINASQFILGTDKVNILLAGSVILASTLLLTEAMCFGHAPFQKSGVEGASLAYFFGAAITAIIYSAHIFLSHDFKQLKLFQSLFRPLKGSVDEFGCFLKKGLICTAQVASDMAFAFLLNAMSIYFGVQAQAAFGLLSQCMWVNSIVSVQMGMAAGTQLGRAIENPEKKLFLNVVGAAGMMVSAIAGSVIPALLVRFPNFAIQLLGNDDAEVAQLVGRVMLPFAIGSSLDSACFSVMLQSWALNDLLGSTLARMLGLLIGFVAAVTFAFATPLGLEGLSSGSPVAMLASLLFLMNRWGKGIENKMQEPISIADNIASFHHVIEMGPIDDSKMVIDGREAQENDHSIIPL
ncbi:MAG: hypothetical protein Q8L78_07085 [Coxiellaceae bacterium]|nr:hypothetical protein [Coxiellaceae bacterium]